MESIIIAAIACYVAYRFFKNILEKSLIATSIQKKFAVTFQTSPYEFEGDYVAAVQSYVEEQENHWADFKKRNKIRRDFYELLILKETAVKLHNSYHPNTDFVLDVLQLAITQIMGAYDPSSLSEAETATLINTTRNLETIAQVRAPKGIDQFMGATSVN